MLVESEDKYASGVNLLYFSLALREWMFAERNNKKKAKMSNEDLLVLAKGHWELWNRIGVFGEPYHLMRSKALFEEFFEANPAHDTPDDLVVYCKVLQHLGELDAAANIVRVIVNNHDGEPDYPQYLFLAGCIYKSMKLNESANNYFFEAAQVGPPRFFNKLEMMIIISRTIEELQGEDADEDSYRMVHAHLALEGHIPEDSDYDDWICDANTWLSLGDKCVFHQMYSLAADFYGLGITRDPEAYKKPRLWFRFAKACYRAGRPADAQLAVKVSVYD